MSKVIIQGVKPGLTVYKVLCIGLLALQVLVLACMPEFANYGLMCFVSLAQLALFVAMALASPCRQPFCILFLVANWIFNCGQIACIAAGHGYADVLNLDFRLFGTQTAIETAFRFYLYSQTLIAAGIFLFQKLPADKIPRDKAAFGINNTKAVAKCLIVAGLPFWLYVNASKMIAAARGAYRGVYSLVIPAPVQAASFFFEAGLLLMLLIVGRERKGAALFWAVVAINVILMATGSRQYSVCFLAVWCLIYFYYLKRLSVVGAVSMVLVCVMLLFVIDAFGELRTAGFSIELFSAYLANASFFDVVWDSLGEFGCAFSTLVVCVGYVPAGLSYGLGNTYLAGLLSVIPTLVSYFPGLKSATLFTRLIPGTSSFGGSMLGEFYYNFGWFGLVGPFLIGILLAWCQNRLNESNEKKRLVFVWVAAVVSVFLLLFIRGYFTEAIMKLVYVFLAAWIADGIVRRFSSRKTDRPYSFSRGVAE